MLLFLFLMGSIRRENSKKLNSQWKTAWSGWINPEIPLKLSNPLSQLIRFADPCPKLALWALDFGALLGGKNQGRISVHAQSKSAACTRIIEAEQLQGDEPSKSTFFNSSSQLLRNVLVCLCPDWSIQVRVEQNRAGAWFFASSQKWSFPRWSLLYMPQITDLKHFEHDWLIILRLHQGKDHF